MCAWKYSNTQIIQQLLSATSPEIVLDLRKYAFILASVVIEEESWPGHPIQRPLMYGEGPQNRSLYHVWTVVAVNPNSSRFDSRQQRMIVPNTSVTHIAI